MIRILTIAAALTLLPTVSMAQPRPGESQREYEAREARVAADYEAAMARREAAADRRAAQAEAAAAKAAAKADGKSGRH